MSKWTIPTLTLYLPGPKVEIILAGQFMGESLKFEFQILVKTITVRATRNIEAHGAL